MSRIARLVIPNRVLPDGLIAGRGHRVPAFDTPIERMERSPVSFTGDYSWQDDATKCLSGNRLTKLISPTGSGKTEIVKAALYHYAKMGKKSLIVVPLVHIGEGFKVASIKRANGELNSFTIGSEFDFRGVEDTYHKQGTVRGLRNWLTQPVTNTFNGRIAIATYSSLVRAFREMVDNNEIDRALSNLWLAVDEAHHISGVIGDEDNLDDKERSYLKEQGTYLGDVCESLMRLSDSSLSVISATHFRGDGMPMFLEKASKSFVTYERDFRDHWEWLGISEFHYNCSGYDNDPSDTLVETILFERDEHHIVCVPAKNKRFRQNRVTWIDDLILELEDRGIRCMDLVTDANKERNKNRLREDNKKYKRTGETDFDVIVACNLMREGTDWPPASRIHDFAPSASSTRTIQTIGRMLRRDDKKSTISYTAYFQNLQKHADKEEVREHVSDRVNVALSGLLVAEDLFRPIKIDFRRGKTTLTEMEDKLFGDNKGAVKEVFLVELDAAMREGKVTPDNMDDVVITKCAQKALSGWEGNLLDRPDAVKWLWEFAVRTVNANGTPIETRDTTISPTIEITPGRLDPGEIRESGFDTTTRMNDGLLLFGSKTDRGSLDTLNGIVRPIQQRASDYNRRMMEVRATNRKDPAAKRKAAKLKEKKRRNINEKIVAPSGTEG